VPESHCRNSGPESGIHARAREVRALSATESHALVGSQRDGRRLMGYEISSEKEFTLRAFVSWGPPLSDAPGFSPPSGAFEVGVVGESRCCRCAHGYCKLMLTWVGIRRRGLGEQMLAHAEAAMKGARVRTALLFCSSKKSRAPVVKRYSVPATESTLSHVRLLCAHALLMLCALIPSRFQHLGYTAAVYPGTIVLSKNLLSAEEEEHWVAKDTAAAKLQKFWRTHLARRAVTRRSPLCLAFYTPNPALTLALAHSLVAVLRKNVASPCNVKRATQRASGSSSSSRVALRLSGASTASTRHSLGISWMPWPSIPRVGSAR
jgi:hypothetical protein